MLSPPGHLLSDTGHDATPNYAIGRDPSRSFFFFARVRLVRSGCPIARSRDVRSVYRTFACVVAAPTAAVGAHLEPKQLKATSSALGAILLEAAKQDAATVQLMCAARGRAGGRDVPPPTCA